MNKLDKIIALTELFYKNSLHALAQAQSFTMPDSPEETNSKNNNLLDEAENFDPKDEDLSNQFINFMKSYESFLDSLTINPSNLGDEGEERFEDLLGTLKSRYERIMNNSYLNMSSDEGYDEDFDPGELTSFIQKVWEDVENKMKSAVDGAQIDDIVAAQYAQEFNQQMIDRGDKNITFTGDKVQQLLEAKRNWLKNLMFIKKVGKTHPEYHRYENYIIGRRRNYQTIMNDPERRDSYRTKARERFAKFSKKLAVRKQELQELISKTKDPKKLSELQSELSKVEQQIEQRKLKKKEVATKVRELKHSGTLDGLVIHLQQKLASKKKDVVKAIKSKADKDPYFTQFKQAVAIAKDRMDKEPSPANQNTLETAIRAEVDAIEKYLNNQPAVNKIRQDFPTIYDFRDKSKAISGMLAHEGLGISEEVVPIIHQVIREGESLITVYGKTYASIIETVHNIVQFLKSKL